MKRPNETLQERIGNRTLCALAPEFIEKIRTTAKVNGQHEDAIYKQWKQYSEDCQNADQSACFPEFCQWYKLANVVDYDEPVLNGATLQEVA